MLYIQINNLNSDVGKMTVKVVDLSKALKHTKLYSYFTSGAIIVEHGTRNLAQCCITTTNDLWDNGKTLFITREKFYNELLELEMKDTYPHIKYYINLGNQSEALRFINIINPDVIIYNHNDDLARLLKASLSIPTFSIYGSNRERITQTLDKTKYLFQDSYRISPLGESIILNLDLCNKLNLNIKRCMTLLPYRRIPVGGYHGNCEYAYDDNRFTDKEKIQPDHGAAQLYVNYKIVEMISNTTLRSEIDPTAVGDPKNINKNNKILSLIRQLKSIEKELLELMD